jgi:hypothetical protein
VLGLAFLICSAVGLYLLADLRSSPSGFPWPEESAPGRPMARRTEPF